MLTLLARPVVLLSAALALAGVAGRAAEAGRADSFALIGTASFPGGGFAVFDGNRPEYQGALHTGETLGEWTLTEIAHQHVRLKSAGREIELPIEHQLRRGAAGWETARVGEPFHPRETPPVTIPAPTPAGGPPPALRGLASAPPEAAPSDKALLKIDKKLLDALKPGKEKPTPDFPEGDKSMKRIAKELRKVQ